MDFQVFSLTVCFGLFHGLVLFPVMLAVAGPNDDTAGPNDENETKLNKPDHPINPLNGHSNAGFD